MPKPLPAAKPRAPRAPSTSSTTPARGRKRRRQSSSTKDVFPVRAILDENKTHYFLDWAPDAATGKAYDPTWEPKAHATPALVADWKKRRKKAATDAAAAAELPGQRGILDERDGKYLIAWKDSWLAKEDVVPELKEEWATRKKHIRTPSFELWKRNDPATPPSAGQEGGAPDDGLPEQGVLDGAETTAGAGSGVDFGSQD